MGTKPEQAANGEEAEPDAVPIKLIEHEESEPTPLSEDELRGLIELVPSLAYKPAGKGRFILNPRGVVGVGTVNGRRVEVRPKITIDRLMFLVSYSLDPVKWASDLTPLEDAPDLIEAIVPAFANAVYRATRRGLLRGYQLREEALATVRGRIDFLNLAKKRHGLFPPIDCRFDDYNEDIEANRLLLAATNRLLKLSRLGPELVESLRHLRARFAHVSPTRYQSQSVPEVSYTRLNAHYRPAVELARLILRERSIDFPAGQAKVEGFFLNMARVFEDFVVVALRESLGLDQASFPRGNKVRHLNLDRERKVRLEPDLSWWEAGKCVFVGDVKYKVTPPSAGVKHPDIYQLLAYTQATDLNEGVLVYAAGLAEESDYRIMHSDKRFTVRTLDLSQEPAELLKQIDEIATSIQSQRERQDAATDGKTRLVPA